MACVGDGVVGGGSDPVIGEVGHADGGVDACPGAEGGGESCVEGGAGGGWGARGVGGAGGAEGARGVEGDFVDGDGGVGEVREGVLVGVFGGGEDVDVPIGARGGAGEGGDADGGGAALGGEERGDEEEALHGVGSGVVC